MSFVLDSAEQITRRLDSMVATTCPAAGRKAMYGGIVFGLEQRGNETMVCGHFIYKNHVNLESSEGYQLEDPNQVLLGSGKFRRHIKLICLEDIEDKSVQFMLDQAFAKAQSN